MQRDWVEERKMKARREKNKLKDSRIRLACVWSKHSYLFLCIFSRSFVHWPVSCLFGFCSFTFDICVKSKRPKYQIVVIMSIDRHRRWANSRPFFFLWFHLVFALILRHFACNGKGCQTVLITDDMMAFNEPHVLPLTQKTTASRHEYAPTALMTRLTRMNALRTAKSDGGEYVFLSFFSFAYLCLHTIGEHELRCGEAWKLQKWRQLLTCRIVLAIELLACCELSRVWSLVHMEVHSPIASISFQSWIVYCVMVEGVTLSAHTDSYLIWFHYFSFALFFFHL